MSNAAKFGLLCWGTTELSVYSRLLFRISRSSPPNIAWNQLVLSQYGWVDLGWLKTFESTQPSWFKFTGIYSFEAKLTIHNVIAINKTKPDPPPRNGCVWQKRTQRDRDGEFGAAVKPSQGTIVYPTISTKCPQALMLTVNTHACHYRHMYKWYILSPEAGRKLENRKTTIAHLVFFPFSEVHSKHQNNNAGMRVAYVCSWNI